MKKMFLKMMLLRGTVFIFCSHTFASVHSSGNQASFTQGNSQFLQGHFKLARENYEKIQMKSSVVWHNIGNSFFNEKNYGNALVCWQRAQIGANWHQLGQLFISEQKALSILQIPTLSRWQYELKRVLIITPQLLVQILLLFFLSILLFFLYRCWCWPSLYGFASCNYKVAWFLMLGIIGCAMVWCSKERIFKKGKAIVVKEKVVAYAGPETLFHKKFQLPLGGQVNIVMQGQEMYKVSYNGQLGWVVPDSIEIV